MPSWLSGVENLEQIDAVRIMNEDLVRPRSATARGSLAMCAAS